MPDFSTRAKRKAYAENFMKSNVDRIGLKEGFVYIYHWYMLERSYQKVKDYIAASEKHAKALDNTHALAAFRKEMQDL
jgi:hypothetical protein